MYASEIFGGMGSLFTPMNHPRGRYAYGIVTDPKGLNQPFLIVTNGKISYTALDSTKYTGLIGQATIPVIMQPVNWNDKDGKIKAFQDQVDAFISESRKDSDLNIHYYLDLAFSPQNVTHMNGKKVTIRHLLTKVWPKLKPTGFVSWEDNSYRYLATEVSSFSNMVDNLQYIITTRILPRASGQFEMVPYGLGTVKASVKGLSVEEYPAWKSNFKPGNSARMYFISETRNNSDKAYTFAYTYLLAAQIAKMFTRAGVMSGKPLTMADYMALASEIIASKVGYGENSSTTMYKGTDIEGQVRDEIANGIATAYPWQNFTDEVFEELLEFWIIKGIVCARIKALTAPVTIELQHGDRIRAAFDYQKETNAELPGLGGEGQPYLFMASNTPGDKLLFPMQLRDESFGNTYSRRFTRTLSLAKVNVKNSEIQGTPLEPTQLKEQFIQWVIENDARRLEITYPWYKLWIWRLPIHTWDTLEDDEGNSLLSAKYQYMLYMLGQLAQGTSFYSDGWFVHDTIGLYGSIQTPVVDGAPNPIQEGIAATLEKAKEQKAVTGTTPRPEHISEAETALQGMPAQEPTSEVKAPPMEGAEVTGATKQSAPVKQSVTAPAPENKAPEAK